MGLFRIEGVGFVILGRTLKKRAKDVMVYFGRPCTSNGPAEAIKGRLEHLRGSALGFRNLTNYIARSLLMPADSDPNYTLDCVEPQIGLHLGINATRPEKRDPGGPYDRWGLGLGPDRNAVIELKTGTARTDT